MSLREDFRDVAYDLARLLDKKVELLHKKKVASINYIKTKTEAKIEKDLKKIERKLILKSQYELNIAESNQIAEINRKITNKKIQCVEDFIDLLKEELVKKIENNPEKYFAFMKEKVMEFLKLVNLASNIYVNERDLAYLKKNSASLLLPKRDIIKLSDNTIDTLCGFQIIDRNNTFCIDFTFESLILQHKQELSIEFMKIFPIFKVDVKNAMEIDRMKHNGENIHG